MSTPQLLGLVGVLVAASLLISAICYWLMAKLFRAGTATFPRGLAVAVCSAMPSLLALGALAWNSDWIEQCPVPFLLASFGLNVLVPLIATAVIFRASVWRSLGIMIASGVLAGCIGFVLALGVRATVAEAFEIPTGSMAPTLFGSHVVETCPNCRREIAIGMVDVAAGEGRFVRPMDVEAECVNCGHRIRVAPISSDSTGDRILVDKTVDVERWNLAVFRKPGEPQVDYVKRMIGLPGETINWHGGEVFADGNLLRKPPDRLDSLWIVVNDSAFVPKETGERGWTSDGDGPEWKRDGTAWTAAAEGDSTPTMRYGGEINDVYEYNHDIGRRQPYTVTDVMLRLTDVRLEGGELRFDWKWRGMAIRFEINDDAKLFTIRQREPQSREIAEQAFDSSSSLTEPIELAIRDGQAYVRQGGRVLASGEFGLSTLTAFRELDADAMNDGESGDVSMSLRGGSVRVGRLELLRDVYFLSPAEIAPGGGPHVFIQPGEPIVLGGDEFLALGDNSSHALDSRFWGPVPQDALIGVAKWIYWPPRRARTFD